MKRFLLIFLSILYINLIYAQTCLPEGITFTTQEQIDDFQTNYPGCTEVLGTVSIESDQIYNLEGLSNLTSIFGDLYIGQGILVTGSPQIVSLSGLENLTYLGDELRITNCDNLLSLDALESLETIENNISIQANDSLNNLIGFHNLNEIKDLLLNGNDNLESLEGLENITKMSEGIGIWNNPILESIAALSSLDTVRLVSIENNESLLSLNGLEGIDYFGTNNSIGALIVIGNDALLNLEGLPPLETLFLHVIIANNSNMNSLSGLENVKVIGGGLLLEGLPSLESVNKLSLLEHVSGELSLVNCDQLSNIDSLSHLNYIASIEIADNLSLQNINGLSQLNSKMSYIYINDNDVLESLSPLSNLLGLRQILEIINNPLLTNLNGLNSIDSAFADIRIENNNSLTSLSGLNNLHFVSETFTIKNNQYLTDISQLSNLTMTPYYYSSLVIEDNEVLSSLNGLQSLTALGSLKINGNNALSNLIGLENLETIQLSLSISNNGGLTSLGALINLNFVGSGFGINNNDALVSLEGLNNATFSNSGITGINILGNQNLTSCSIQNVCSFIDNSNEWQYDISDNASGCDNEDEVIEACLTYVPCFEDGITFSSQEEIDSFPDLYPGCNIIYGDVIIEGDDIENLDGLSIITQINGDLNIGYDYGNPILTDLEGLSNLYIINGGLFIVLNNELENLLWLNNISASNLDEILISENQMLSYCSYNFICESLIDAGVIVQIEYNAEGCYTNEEVEESCNYLSINENQNIEVSLYPNPVNSELQIRGLDGINDFEINIFNHLGQVMSKIKNSTYIDLSDYPSGIYIIEITWSGNIIHQKIIKE